MSVKIDLPWMGFESTYNILKDIIHTLIVGTTDLKFLCKNEQQENVTVLQFCDGARDCADNSDEPSLCASGICT